MKALYLFLFLSVVPVVRLIAQNTPAVESPRMIEVEAYFIRATPEEISSAITASGGSSGLFGADEFSKILANLKGTDASIFGNPRAVTISGMKGVAYAGKEFPYPVEYQADKESGKNYPISFERRNLGITFSFEPVAGPNDRINITVEPEYVSFLGFVDFSESAPPKNSSMKDLLKGNLKEGGVWQPVFSQFRVSTSIILQSGQTTLMGGVAEEVSSQAALDKGAIKAPDKARLIYVFVTARIIKDS